MADEEIVDQFDDGAEDIEEPIDTDAEDPVAKRLRDKDEFIGRQSSEIAELRRIAEERERQLLQYQQTTQYQQPVSPSGDPYEAINQQFWENPGLTAAQMVQQQIQAAQQVAKQAHANTKRALAELRSDPIYARVADALDAELAGVDDSVLANPQQAGFVVEAMFERVVGQMARKMAKGAQADPTSRSQMLEALGVASPQSSNGDTASDALTAKDKEMLAAIGITGKKQAEIAKKAAERENE